MKRKILALISVFALSLVGMNFHAVETCAQEEMELQTDYSYLLTDDAVVGQMEAETRGTYLLDGTSLIAEAGTGKIAAGGITNAAKQCDVSINVIVERLSGDKWVRVTSWTASLPNEWTVATSKTMSVARGYYYRVRCIHYAHTDVSSSVTSSIWR